MEEIILNLLLKFKVLLLEFNLKILDLISTIWNGMDCLEFALFEKTRLCKPRSKIKLFWIFWFKIGINLWRTSTMNRNLSKNWGILASRMKNLRVRRKIKKIKMGTWRRKALKRKKWKKRTMMIPGNKGNKNIIKLNKILCKSSQTTTTQQKEQQS